MTGRGPKLITAQEKAAASENKIIPRTADRQPIFMNTIARKTASSEASPIIGPRA